MLIDTLFLFLSFISLSLCDEHIDSVNKFISFSNAVNSGKDYFGTTVLLDVDIDFSGGHSEQFSQIGNYSYVDNTKKPFNGVFDGQGHTISNLLMKYPLESVGLFGFSQGATIKNIVIDSSCSFTSSVISSHSRCYAYAGSILGISISSHRSCVIENSVSMASVSFIGNISSILFLGGIAGAFSLQYHSNAIKNCANYGSVTHSGICDYVTEIGGISGTVDRISGGSTSVYNYIQNCVNYGTITHNGTPTILAAGGIAGNSVQTYFDNCVNSGNIITNQESDYIGAILGDITKETGITHCYWTSVVSNYNVYGFNEDTVTDKDNSLVSLNKETLDELNKYAAKNNTWNKWVILYLDGGRINNFTQESIIGIQKALPVPVKEGYSLLFWCKDAETTIQYDPETDTDVIELYAGWKINNYTVTFDFDNGTVINETFTFNTFIELPKGVIEREGYTFNGWDNKTSLTPAKNITITAQWIINSYTLTFDFDNGTVINKTFAFNTLIELPKGVIEREGYTFNGWNNKTSLMPAKNITVTAQWTPNKYLVSFNVNGGDNLDINEQYVLFNSPYGKLPTPTRANYTFIGWFNDKNENFTSETIVSIANNHVLTAQWKHNPTCYVQIVFNTKDMNKDEIDTIVGGYSKSGYTIMKIEGSETGETKVVIRFNDPETAENFVETITTSSDVSGVIGFISEFAESLSLGYYPLILLSLFIL